ncbi:MFS transporter [Streptomyces sp. NPDC059247]|uniref:MFS transporter n=1 Tax=Streptomyces sp. NPDC059247 TaxID=3346790 RepID=UPI003673CB96
MDPAPGRRPFRKLWAATATSNLSDGISLAAAPLLAATVTHDPALIAGITVAQRAPWLVLSFISGVLADRLDRRRVAQAANWIRAAGFVVLALAVLGDAVSMPLLYVVFFAVGTAETLYDSSSSAWLPTLVAPDELGKANGRLQTTFVVCNEFVGPPVGGFLFASAAMAPFVLGATGYVAAVGLLALIPTATRHRREPLSEPLTVKSVAADIAVGARWYWSSPTLRSLSVVAATGNAVNAATYGVLVLLATDVLGVPSSWYGVLLAAGAIGAVAGGLVAGRIGEWMPTGTLILVTNLLSAGSTIGMGLAISPAVTVAFMALDGFAVLVQNVQVVTLRQQIVPNGMMGRVTSAYRSVAVGAFTVGGVAGGLVAKFFGIPAAFYAGGAAMAVTAFMVLPVLNNRRLAQVKTEAAERGEAPANHDANAGGTGGTGGTAGAGGTAGTGGTGGTAGTGV